MIHSVHIHNFQSHDDTALDLSPGISTLTGDSDQGKSAAMRAILWAVTNRPQGDAYVSDWTRTPKGRIKAGEACWVDVSVASGAGSVRVTRRRSDDFNGYLVGATRYEALRTDVPDDVARAFNIGPVNIQRQMDPPFLVGSKPAEAARFINQLVNLSDIDEAVSAATSMTRDNARQLKEATAEAEAAEKRAVTLVALSRNADDAMFRAEAAEKGIAEAQKRHDTATETLGRWESLDAAARALEAPLSRAEDAMGAYAAALNAERPVTARYNAAVTTSREYAVLPRFSDELERAEKALGTYGALEEPVRKAGAVAALAPTIKPHGDAARVCGMFPALERAGLAIMRHRDAGMAIAQRMRDADPHELAAVLKAWEAAGRVAGLDLSAVVAPLNRANRAERAMQAKRDAVAKLSAELRDYKGAGAAIEDIDEHLARLRLKLDGAVCPTCGRPLHL